VVVAADPARVAWRRGKAGDAGEAVDVLERAQVAAGVGQERRRQHHAEAGHADQDRCVGMVLEPFLDLVVQLGEVGVDRHDLLGQPCDEPGAHRLGGQHRVLSMSRFHRLGCKGCSVAGAALLEPGRQPRGAQASDSVRSLIAGRQDQRRLLGVVERGFQRREVLQHGGPQPVDRADPVEDQIRPSSGQ
jgi:hypothetical protein